MSYRDFLKVRVFDSWMHEQDIRRALDRPGHLDGPVVALSLERFDGSARLRRGQEGRGARRVHGRVRARRWASGLHHRRRRGPCQSHRRCTERSDRAADMPFETFVALCGGRQSADDPSAIAEVVIGGDRELGRRVLEAMPFTP